MGSGDGFHPTNPERARIAVELLTQELQAEGFEIVEPSIQDGDREKLELNHSKDYVARVLDQGISSEWTCTKPELGQIVRQMDWAVGHYARLRTGHLMIKLNFSNSRTCDACREVVH